MRVLVTLDNISPLIEYKGEWLAGSAKDDNQASRYSNGGTFAVSQSNDDFAVLNFIGTNITVFGAKRGNHNVFNVTLDTSTVTANGHPDGDDQFQVPLYTSPVLEHGQHRLIVQNASPDPSQPFLDIDFIQIDSDITGYDIARVDDADSAWQYEPENAWSLNPLELNGFSDSSGHVTAQPRASATLSFLGSAVDLYGLVCPSCGAYWVQVDGGDPQAFSAYNPVWTKPQTLLYMGRELDEGYHTLTVTNLGLPSQSTLNIDYAVVYGTESTLGVHAVNSTQNDQGQSQGQAPSPVVHNVKGTIIAAVLLPVGIIIIGLALLLWQRRRRGWPFNTPRADSIVTPFPPPMQQVVPQSSASSSFVMDIPASPSATKNLPSLPDEAGARAGDERVSESSNRRSVSAAYPFGGVGPSSHDRLPEYRETPTHRQVRMWQEQRTGGFVV